MTRYSKIHLIVMLLTFLFVNKLHGQTDIVQSEIIPYRLAVCLPK